MCGAEIVAEPKPEMRDLFEAVAMLSYVASMMWQPFIYI